MSSRRIYSLGSWAILLSASVLMGCDGANAQQPSAPPPRAEQLTIVTPHNDNICETFARAFTEWYHERHGTTVIVNYVRRGTPECVEYIYEAYGDRNETYGGKRADVFFGGGVREHRLLSERDMSVAIDLGDALANIPETVAGVATRDADKHWYATGLSSFGLLVNRDLCEKHGIHPPSTWTDLADPRFYSWVGLADPSRSGSHRLALVLVLQKQGWEQGWGAIIRMLANSRAMMPRSSTALQNTDIGLFLASPAVNFDGMEYAYRSANRLVYVNPIGDTVVTPDLISVLAATRNKNARKVAEEFVKFCLSEKAQMLWGAKVADKTPLFHYPILPSVYESSAVDLAVKDNPFKVEFGLKYDVERGIRQANVLTPMIQAATGDNHVLLQRAWQAVVAAGSPEDALAELTAPPLGEDDAFAWGATYVDADEAEQARLRAELAAGFAERYRAVLKMVEGDAQ